MGPWVCTHRSSHGGVTVSFQNEVSMLKNEVAQLKQLLLTHKDCPITAMQKESQGYLSKSLAFWLLFFFLVSNIVCANFALDFIERAKGRCRFTSRQISF